MERSLVRLHARRLSRLILAAGLVAAQAGCDDDDDDDGGTGVGGPPPQQVTITMSDFAFTPRVDTVAVGGTVTWTNAGAAPHTSTSTADPSLWDSGSLATGQSFPRVFPAAGSFDYDCTIHPQMTGRIVAR